MKQVSASVIIAGLVQGVYFRDSTRSEAMRNNCTGWVRNNPDGTVEALIEGREEDVKRVIKWCGQGPERARVDNLKINWNKEAGNFASFRIDH